MNKQEKISMRQQILDTLKVQLYGRGQWVITSVIDGLQCGYVTNDEDYVTYKDTLKFRLRMMSTIMRNYKDGISFVDRFRGEKWYVEE